MLTIDEQYSAFEIVSVGKRQGISSQIIWISSAHFQRIQAECQLPRVDAGKNFDTHPPTPWNDVADRPTGRQERTARPSRLLSRSCGTDLQAHITTVSLWSNPHIRTELAVQPGYGSLFRGTRSSLPKLKPPTVRGVGTQYRVVSACSTPSSLGAGRPIAHTGGGSWTSVAVLLQPALVSSHDPGLVRRHSLDSTGWG